jgi:hypothetical protein
MAPRVDVNLDGVAVLILTIGVSISDRLLLSVKTQEK